MYCALALRMFLLQSFWGGLNFFQQWSENLVDEINLNCGLDTFEYDICCITYDGLNLSIDAPSFEETLLDGIEQNGGCNLSVGAASFDALLELTDVALHLTKYTMLSTTIKTLLAS